MKGNSVMLQIDNDNSDSDVSMTDSEDDSDSFSVSSSDSVPDVSETTAETNFDVSTPQSEEEEDEVVKAIKRENQRPRDKPPPIHCDDFIVDICFHPHEDILAVANVVGDVLLYKYANEENILLDTVELHTRSCRDVEFNHDGKTMVTVSKDMSIMLTDVETRKLKNYYEKAHDSPIYCVSVIDEDIIATGDDDGVIKLWDSRLRKEDRPLLCVKKNEDYISDIITNDAKRYLCCSSGDGSLTTIDLQNRKFLMQSIEYEEEFTCLGYMRHETKLLTGSNKGKLFLFNTNEFGMHSDEFPGTKSAVNSLIPITENIVVTACEDGNLRATHLFPHRHLGIVGQHDMSIEKVDICNNGRFIASSGHNNDIRFWNIQFFEDFEKVSHKHNKHNTKKEMEHNLPSSNRKNVSEFFCDLA